MDVDVNKHYKSITRMDYPRKYMVGWWVRVRYEGKEYKEWFPDHDYDTPAEGLAAAIEWRNMTERDIGKLRSERPVITRAHSNSGVLGVTRRKRRSRIDRGQLVEGFEVAWKTADRRVGRAFVSIRKYGEKGALERAAAIRHAMVLKHYAEKPTDAPNEDTTRERP